MLDILIQNGLVIDTTGKPAFSADMGIRPGRIARIRDLALPWARIQQVGPLMLKLFDL
jgi:N-acyl-D-aspartate/D-glutamate deacylase